MSWEDDHREDGLWQLIDDAQSSISEHIREEELDSSDSKVQRLRALLSHAAAYRDHPDVLITPSARRNAGKAVEVVASNLPDVESLYKAPAGGTVSKFEELARIMRSWPQRGSVSLAGLKQHVQQLEGTLSNFREVASTKLEEVRVESSGSLEEVVKKHDEVLEQFRADVTEAQHELQQVREVASAVEEAVKQSEARIEEALQSHRTVFEEEQEQRSTASTERLDAQIAEWEKSREEARGLSDGLIADIDKKKDEAEKLLGAIAQRSTATDYGAWAMQQRRSAFWWSVTAVVLFILASLVFIESTFHFVTSPSVTPSGDSLWGEVVTRLGMTAVVLAGALYAAKEAGQHRKEERKAKARELVLTTMDPFMANIDEDVRVLLRSEAARAIFVLRDQEETADEKDAMAERLWHILRRPREQEQE